MKTGKVDGTIFKLFSKGYKTARDAIHLQFSHDDACAENGLQMTRDYLDALRECEVNPALTPDAAARHHDSNLKWDKQLKHNLRRKKRTEFDEDYIRKVAYRPFVATNCYADYTFANSKYRMDQIFPDSLSENRVICVLGVGSKRPFSALITDTMPDLHFSAACQCFPRYSYPRPVTAPNGTDFGGRVPRY